MKEVFTDPLTPPKRKRPLADNSNTAYKRKGGKTAGELSLISFREKSIAFNSHYIVSNALAQMTCLKIFPPEES